MCKSGEKITDTDKANDVEDNIIEPISAGTLSINQVSSRNYFGINV